MSTKIQATSRNGHRFSTLLNRGIQQKNTNAVGIAVAYVSTYGFNYIDDVLNKNNITQRNMVADISDCVTHPNALRLAVDSGWNVRVVDDAATFHPKFYIGCRDFDVSDAIVDPSFVIISSANLSYGGLLKNAECTFMQISDAPTSCLSTWETLWGMGTRATKKIITDYQSRFSERNRKRRPDDLVAIGVADVMPEKSGGLPAKGISPPPDRSKALSGADASMAWVGLKSHTGEYDLQVEIPKKVAPIFSHILSSAAPNGDIDILCADGSRRHFKFWFYERNGMYRLNITNDAPNAKWARDEKDGIACVEMRDGNEVFFNIIKPGRALEDVVDHSLALGTWGRTSTRLFGWY